MSTPAVSTSAAVDSLILRDTYDKDKTDLPEVFRTADRGAMRSQKWYFFFVRAELIAISLAALAQVVGPRFAPDIASALQIHIGGAHVLGSSFTASELTHNVASYILPAFFLAIAVLMFLLRLILPLDRRWRGRRALAEAAKSLAWRYSMRALHEDLVAKVSLDLQQANQAFNAELTKLVKQSRGLHLDPPKPDDVQLTKKMKDLREQDDSALQGAVYMKGRLNNQQGWYSKKANRYQKWTNWLQGARFVAYGIGVVLIFYQGLGSNGLGIMTTIAGAFATWLAGKHYDDLSQSYGSMARLLGGLAGEAPNSSPSASAGASGGSDTSWAQFADKVETLMDGEHRVWLRLTGSSDEDWPQLDSSAGPR